MSVSHDILKSLAFQASLSPKEEMIETVQKKTEFIYRNS
jgi:hypothetical protein